MNEQERVLGIASTIAEEEEQGQLNLYWLSFADSSLPAGQQFLGVAIVQAYGIATAIRKAHLLGINPGGEVASFELPPEAMEKVRDHMDVLLSKAELEARGLS